MALVDRTVRDLLAAFASSDPTPGGGSAAALASATGASLLAMVAGLPKSRSGLDADRAALAAASAALTAVRAGLADAIDADTAAYDRVVAAYRLPKSTPAEQAARTADIREALRGATGVPLLVMRLSVEALEQAVRVAASGHAGASSDVGTGVALLRAGLQGARLNVEINIGGIRDEGYASAVRAEVQRLLARGNEAADVAERSLRDR